MISNMELTSEKEDDDNYSLLYLRKKRENFLTLNSKAQQEVAQVPSPPSSSARWSATRPTSSTSTSLANVTTPSTGTGTSRRESSAGLSATCS